MKLKSRKTARSAETSAVSEFVFAHHLTRAMKKIRCPNCAVVNLEKFVSYPHCAGCGALLTDKEPQKPRWAAWKRPLGPILWATVVGGAALAAVAALMLLSARPVVTGILDVTWEFPRQTTQGDTVEVSLGVNTIDTRRITILKEVTLRVDKEFLRDFPVAGFEPKPRSQTQLGKGIYFAFGSLPLGQQIKMKLRATRSGRYKMRVNVAAEGQKPDELTSAWITVAPKGSTKTPISERENHEQQS